MVYADVYMLDDGGRWKELPPMPKPNSHIEFAWVILKNSIVIVGGSTEKHPVTKKMILVREVIRFDLDTLVIQPNFVFPWFYFERRRVKTFTLSAVSVLFLFVSS